jgi:hypothetical protein
MQSDEIKLPTRIWLTVVAILPVGWSPTATNAQDQVTLERGGPSPYRAVEPWLYIIIILWQHWHVYMNKILTYYQKWCATVDGSTWNNMCIKYYCNKSVMQITSNLFKNKNPFL